MIRVLQVYPQINDAGTERVIFNLYENIDTTQVQFDFLVERPGKLDKKITDMGGKIYYLYKKEKGAYYSALLHFFSEHPEYKIVHTHTHARMGLVLKAAKSCGVQCRIAHSHNARNDLPRVVSFMKGIKSIPIEKSATHFFACSLNAAKWLFPHKANECKVIYNGINLNRYMYDEHNRLRVRKSLGISENTFVLIHVGRFASEKNHKYIVKILESYNKEASSEWKMLFVGEGPLEEAIRTQVKDAGIMDHVLFLGARNDVNRLYSAADLFLFPSLHEGLGIVVIEAQASGLPCVVSDAIPPEADLEVGLLNTVRLNENSDKWVEMIETIKQVNNSREHQNHTILNGKYNIKRVAEQMQQFYLENRK